jgi:methyl-accepting chemotaxis protein
VTSAAGWVWRGKTGFFGKISAGMNQLVETSEQGLSDVARVLSALSQGDLTQRITRDYAGLFANVKDSVNATNEALSKVIGEVRSASDALTNAAGQVNATAQSLSQSASEQAASVEQTSSSVNLMSASINQNSDNAPCHRQHGHQGQQGSPGGRISRQSDGDGDETDCRQDWHRR